ncbi:MAG: hypothetical protein COV45_00235 [Deltaproteobacteria bacterium CG11_big_fil_rev_8_21_14_0_20_47_16]|nr:MAG: hypothetical protein COV45_00235 [Deltaproteobacteria bacterium CG11_big_fil_rev_8_21_14_0_20_47_16]
MKRLTQLATITVVIAMMMGMVACNKSPSLRNNGHLLMWYYPNKALFQSTDGRKWTKVNDVQDWLLWLSADSKGQLYASNLGTTPTITTSKDGKKWDKVAPNENNPQGDHGSYALCAGEKTLYALSSRGDFFVSEDGGSTWTKKTRPAAEGARGAGDGFKGYCTVSPDDKTVLIQGWYFSPAGPVLATTTDKGDSWTTIPAPTERNEAMGIGFVGVGTGIVYADYDAVYRTTDNGKTWTKATPEKLVAKDSKRNFYSYRKMVTDGDKIVVVVEAPGKDGGADNKWPGATFYSKDGGATFEVLDLPWNTDPTPTVSDEYVSLTFVPTKG